MAAKYWIENKTTPDCSILFVCNACEEGLGNLNGTRAIFRAYGER